VEGYELWNYLAVRTDLEPYEKLVGMILANSFNQATQRTRMRHDTLMERTGLGYSSVSRAVRGLEDKGVLTRQRTGRSNIYVFNTTPGNGQSKIRVDRSHQTDQIGTSRPNTIVLPFGPRMVEEMNKLREYGEPRYTSWIEGE
jgi:predicted transcriptional regulator